MMDQLFLSILNMSLTASIVITIIILARLALKKAPKFISYALWAVAGFRLMIPFSFEAVFSLLPVRSAPIADDIVYQAVPRIDTGIGLMDEAISGFLPAATPTTSVNPLQIWFFIGLIVWLAGLFAMVGYSFISISLLKKRLAGAVYHSENYYESENLKTPFVIGWIHPKIYLPAGLTEDERTLILLHERTHIARHDHIVKMIAFLILSIHWFNPLVWVAFLLMGADQEMSCDERVLKELGGDVKTLYSRTLVSFAAKGRLINGSPLAFGEGGMKERIKNVLKFHKASRVAMIAAITLALVLTAGLAVNRISEPPPPESSPAAHELEAMIPPPDISSEILEDIVRDLVGKTPEEAQEALAEAGLVALVYDMDGKAASSRYFDGQHWSENQNVRSMTRADLRALARKGDQLSLEDFKEFLSFHAAFYNGQRAYSFLVDSQFELRLYVDHNGKPIEMHFESINGSIGSGIDILDGGLDKFLDTFPHNVREEGGSSASFGGGPPITAQIKWPSLKAEGLIVSLQNPTNADYTYEYVYKLQKKVKNGIQYNDVEIPQGGSAIEAILRDLKANLPTNIAIDWGKLYGELSPGEYRLAMDFTYQNTEGGKAVDDTYYVYFTTGDI